MTLALLQQWTGVSLVTQQYLRITMETDVSTQQRKRRRYYGNGDVIYKEGLGMNLSVGSGERSGADVCIWLRTPFGWKIKFVSGNCVREAREFIPRSMKTSDHRG
jgi:hypothetical protein